MSDNLGSANLPEDLDMGRVRYHVEIEGLASRADVRGLTLSEQLGQAYEAVLELRVDEPPASPRDLLGADGSLWCESQTTKRVIRGLVRHLGVRETHEGTLLTVHLVPGLWLLSHNRDSRIFQDATVVEIVERVYDQSLSSRRRTIRNDTRRSYPRYEYIVQYRESDHDFICRLLERDGIFFYFDHDADGEQHEVMVLADDVPSLRDVNERHGVVSYRPKGGGTAWTEETVTHVEHVEAVGASASMARGYDWTRPNAVIDAKAGELEDQPHLELYDHGSEVRTYAYNSERYEADTSSNAAKFIAERTALARQQWRVSGSVLGATPGTVLEVIGSDLDRKYVVTGNEGRGAATEGIGGNILQ